MAEIKNRLLEYLKINQISKQKFCEITGISYANMVGNSLKSEFGGEQIASILMKFPTLNSDWLLLGKGEMLRKKEEESPQNQSPELLEIVKKQQDIIEKLSSVIENLSHR